MMRFAFIAMILFSDIAAAAERTPWKEPPLGPISSTGATIEVETYRCTVRGPRTIECLNVGRACVAARTRDEERMAKRFGCAIKGEPTYPCPKDDDLRAQIDDMQGCHTTIMGAF